MALGRLQKLKKTMSSAGQNIVTNTLVCGGDILSYYLYSKLPTETVFLVPKKERRELMGPSLLRGNDNLDVFSELYPSETVQKEDSVPAFFREQKFREFGGRSKPENLLPGEEFFTQSESYFDTSIISSNESIDVLDRIPSKIRKNKEDFWEVSCTNGDLITCKDLFWGNDPKILEEILEDEQVSAAIIPFTRALNPLCILHINFNFSEILSEKNGTIFIPVSYTHDWGHFICSFTDGGRSLECIYYIDKTESSEDEVTKKIKILKRSIEKIFPKILSMKCSEEIIVKDTSPCESFDDDAYHGVKHLYLVGMNAPIMGKRKNVSHISRGLLSIHQALVDFKN